MHKELENLNHELHALINTVKALSNQQYKRKKVPELVDLLVFCIKKYLKENNDNFGGEDLELLHKTNDVLKRASEECSRWNVAVNVKGRKGNIILI